MDYIKIIKLFNYSNLNTAKIISTMFKSKRQNYRKSQRRDQIEEFFKVKRLEISMPYSKNISRQQFQMFNKLNNVVNEPGLSQSILSDLVSDLRQLFINYPYYEQTLLVVANFLLNYPQKACLLKDLFLQSIQNLAEKGSYCFYWSYTIFIRAYFFIDKSYFQNKAEQFQKIDEILNKNFQVNIKIFHQSSNQTEIQNTMQKIQNLLQLFIFIIFYKTKIQENSYFLNKILDTLMMQIKNLYKKSKQKQNCNPLLRLKFSLKIKQCVLYFLDNSGEVFFNYRKYMISKITQIIYDSLRQNAEEKDSIIQLIGVLSSQFPLECGQHFILQEIVNELIYILDSTRIENIRIKILTFFSLVLKDLPRNKLITLLNLQFHNKMAEVLKVELIEKNSELILLSLKNIRLLFGQIQELNDEKLFYRCLNSMEAQEQFHKVVQEMTLNKYSDQIQKELAFILDTCYNSQEEEQMY